MGCFEAQKALVTWQNKHIDKIVGVDCDPSRGVSEGLKKNFGVRGENGVPGCPGKEFKEGVK